ncbi:hypothetical protein GCM10010308_00730 [Streptomyces vinaceusdrappus]|nr:hypothetical protein GCM10010301_32620 [Streptomyces plicatus]GHB93972.1 hypothetical protein GCM10010308_00730 [Streptomyces vinaceusdrappus]
MLGEMFPVAVDERVVLIGLLSSEHPQRQSGDVGCELGEDPFFVMPTGHADQPYGAWACQSVRAAAAGSKKWH